MTTDTRPTTDRRHSQQRGPDVQTAQRRHAQHHHTDQPYVGTLGLVTWSPGPAAGFPCQDNPADLWFAELPEEVEAAKALCLECPIREACLAGALERGEPWGVWGGQLVLQGVVVPRKRPRGRPRKDAHQAA